MCGGVGQGGIAAAVGGVWFQQRVCSTKWFNFYFPVFNFFLFVGFCISDNGIVMGF